MGGEQAIERRISRKRPAFVEAILPERVQLLSYRAIGGKLEIRAIGVRSERFYSRILGEEDISKVNRVEVSRKNFSGDPEAFFLAG